MSILCGAPGDRLFFRDRVHAHNVTPYIDTADSPAMIQLLDDAARDILSRAQKAKDGRTLVAFRKAIKEELVGYANQLMQSDISQELGDAIWSNFSWIIHTAKATDGTDLKLELPAKIQFSYIQKGWTRQAS
jgi:hypothetical protein